MRTGVIYSIVNKINGKMYIGLTTNKDKRLSRHKRNLNNNKHRNKHLQNSWNKYGKDNFKFEILEKNISKNNLSQKEMEYIDKLNSFKSGYNLTKGGEGTKGSKPWKNKNRRKETKKKISNSLKGRKIPRDVADKSAKSRRRVTKNKCVSIFKEYYSSDLSQYKIADKHNVSRSLVKDICSCQHWSTKGLEKPKSKNKKTEITKTLAKSIFEDYYNGEYKQEDLCNKYNIGYSTVNKILNKKHPISKRFKCGTKTNNNSKINKQQSLEIKEEYRKNEITQEEISKKYQVSAATISRILNGKHCTTN